MGSPTPEQKEAQGSGTFCKRADRKRQRYGAVVIHGDGEMSSDRPCLYRYLSWTNNRGGAADCVTAKCWQKLIETATTKRGSRD